jgi:hypothetical protein
MPFCSTEVLSAPDSASSLGASGFPIGDLLQETRSLGNHGPVGEGVIEPDQNHEVAAFSRPYSAMWDRESLAAFKLALDVVKAKGIPNKSRDGVDVLIHQAEQVSVEWTVAKQERPNGLNVWRHGDLNSFRVLDVIWTDGTMPLILTYRGGDWERVLRQELPE